MLSLTWSLHYPWTSHTSPSPTIQYLGLLEANEQTWWIQYCTGGMGTLCKQTYVKCHNSFDDDCRLEWTLNLIWFHCLEKHVWSIYTTEYWPTYPLLNCDMWGINKTKKKKIIQNAFGKVVIIRWTHVKFDSWKIIHCHIFIQYSVK